MHRKFIHLKKFEA